MKMLKKYWWLLITFLTITLVFIIGYKGDLPALDWQTGDTLELLGGVFAKLFIVGALLDQLIEVFFPQDEIDIQSRTQALNALSIVKDNEALIHKEILSQQLYGLSKATTMDSVKSLNTQLTTFSTTKQTAEDKIAEIDEKRSSHVRMIAFAAGLVLAITGITILSDFIDMTNKGINHKILSYIDILFTAAVLSGGTSGINKLLKIIKDSWKKS
ncbi:hypothetical protein [Mariniflexile sp. AS56]|uniref:hypothetical protein n=1 Tax=Mariniflexile sp. AS56 TaxID=3063957 RepID=UPI0026ECB912|nr:hypothetical protein [Mariniflexile sp. AS56]MDO7171434.1 hypothetical protein [Mariniflexile sp. AS56]